MESTDCSHNHLQNIFTASNICTREGKMEEEEMEEMRMSGQQNVTLMGDLTEH